MLISTENSAEPRLKDEYPPAQRKQFITFISPPKENHQPTVLRHYNKIHRPNSYVGG